MHETLDGVIRQYDRLAWRYVHRYEHRAAQLGVTTEDLYSEALEALWWAAVRWDPDRDVPFVRFAGISVDLRLRRYLYRRARRRQPLILSLEMVLGEDQTLEDRMGVEMDWTSLDAEDWMIRLSPRDRQLVRMRLAGYSYPEIADRLGVSLRAVYMRMSRLRRKLRGVGA